MRRIQVSGQDLFQPTDTNTKYLIGINKFQGIQDYNATHIVIKSLFFLHFEQENCIKYNVSKMYITCPTGWLFR